MAQMVHLTKFVSVESTVHVVLMINLILSVYLIHVILMDLIVHLVHIILMELIVQSLIVFMNSLGSLTVGSLDVAKWVVGVKRVIRVSGGVVNRCVMGSINGRATKISLTGVESHNIGWSRMDRAIVIGSNGIVILNKLGLAVVTISAQANKHGIIVPIKWVQDMNSNHDVSNSEEGDGEHACNGVATDGEHSDNKTTGGSNHSNRGKNTNTNSTNIDETKCTLSNGENQEQIGQ